MWIPHTPLAFNTSPEILSTANSAVVKWAANVDGSGPAAASRQ